MRQSSSGMAELSWATPEDGEAVLRLIQAYHRQEGLRGHALETLRPVLEDVFEHKSRGRILIAKEGGEVIGYALVVRRPSFEYASEVAVLDEIFIQGKSRERGIGRRMVSYLEEYVASEGLPAITLQVANQNVAAREFYRAVGFDRVDREIYARLVPGPR